MSFDQIAQALNARSATDGDAARADCPVCHYRPGCLRIYRTVTKQSGFGISCNGAGCSEAEVLQHVYDAHEIVAGSGEPLPPMTGDERRAILANELLRQKQRKSKSFDRAAQLWNKTIGNNDESAQRYGRQYLARRALQWDERLSATIRFCRITKGEEEFKFFNVHELRSETYFLVIGKFTTIIDDEMAGVHVTFLDPFAGKITRRYLGLSTQAAIKFDGPGVPAHLYIGEGLETCLSVRQLGYGPVWALGGAAKVGKFPLLTGLDKLSILQERDHASARNCGKLRDKYFYARREVELLLPPRGYNDMNDLLMQRKVKA